MKLLFEKTLFKRLEKAINENETARPIRRSVDAFVLKYAKAIRTIIGVLYFVAGGMVALCSVALGIFGAIHISATPDIGQSILGLTLAFPMGIALVASALSFFLGHRLLYRKKAYAKLFVNISIITYGFSALTLFTSPTLLLFEIVPLCISFILNLLYWYIVHMSTKR